jgi:thioredoxin 1
MASEYVKAVSTSEFEAELTGGDHVTVVDFWAAWCGPCKALAPLLDEVANEQAGKVKVLKVDVDTERELAAKYNVQSIPTLLFFKGGEAKASHIGLLSKKSLIDKIAAAV